MRIDLNCDLGEGAGNDAELMPLITSANVACGAHAGDEATMRATVRLALRHGVAIGAHPGFADRANFGRRELQLSRAEIVQTVAEQIAALQHICEAEGARLVHVKPHGALYNMAARDVAVAEAIAEAMRAFDARLVIVGLADSAGLHATKARGIRVAAEAFADRAYRADGALMPRTEPNSLITDEDAAARQALQIASEGRVQAADGTYIIQKADTLCIHGDDPRATHVVRRVREVLERAGVEIRSLAGLAD